MTSCFRCKSIRIAKIDAKSSDMNNIRICVPEHEGYGISYTLEHEGYLPGDLGIGAGDYIDFAYCLDCGQLQGTFPIPETTIEKDGKGISYEQWENKCGH